MVATIVVRNSEVLNCEQEGRLCLHKFIKTRVEQPNICLNCLKEIGERNNYDMIKGGTLHRIML